MKSLIIVSLSFMFAVPAALAEKTVKNEAVSATRKVVRAVKKGTNRVKEAVCLESDLKCASKKVGNRIEETGVTVSDKVKNTVDKVK